MQQRLVSWSQPWPSSAGSPLRRMPIAAGCRPQELPSARSTSPPVRSRGDRLDALDVRGRRPVAPGHPAALALPCPRPVPGDEHRPWRLGRRGQCQRIVFFSFVGGNTREWRLWTATPTAKRPRLLRTASADADAPSPILLGNGGEEGIPWAVGRDVFVLAGDGHRALTWHAPADIVSLNEHSGLVAATLADGTVQLVPVRLPRRRSRRTRSPARARRRRSAAVS